MTLKKGLHQMFSIFRDSFFYLMFSFKEDSSSEGSVWRWKNIKAWGVHNAKTYIGHLPFILKLRLASIVLKIEVIFHVAQQFTLSSILWKVEVILNFLNVLKVIFHFGKSWGQPLFFKQLSCCIFPKNKIIFQLLWPY